MVRIFKDKLTKDNRSKVIHNKDQLRQEYLSLRNNLATIDAKIKSYRISKNLWNITQIKDSKVIALYLPLEKEVNIKKFIKKALRHKKIVLLPRMEGKTMTFHKIESLKFLSETWKGLKMPVKDSLKYDINQIEVILVPGIIFDNHGCRIGFGAGYYDRYLKNNKKALIYGVAFDFQIFKYGLPTEEHDILMDYVVTNKEIIKGV